MQPIAEEETEGQEQEVQAAPPPPLPPRHPEAPAPQDPHPPTQEPSQDTRQIAHDIVQGIFKKVTKPVHKVDAGCTKCGVKLVLTNDKTICECDVRECSMTATKGQVTTLHGSTYKIARVIVPAWMKRGHFDRERGSGDSSRSSTASH